MPEREIIMKKVYCIETDKTYRSAVEVEREMGIDSTIVSKVCNGKLKSAHGFHFRFANESEIASMLETEDKDITVSLPKVVKGKGKRTNGNTNPVICLDNGNIYTSGIDAAEQNDIAPSQMSTVCRDEGRTAKGKQFCYVKDLHLRLNKISDALSKQNAYNALLEKEAERKRLRGMIADYKGDIDRLSMELEDLYDKLAEAIQTLINMD